MDLIANPKAERGRYPDDLKALLSVARADESRRWLATWDGIAAGPTPLHDLPGLARRLGIARLAYKDESARSRLGSFKALGAPVALVRLILRRWPDDDLDARGLFAGEHASMLAGFTVISATDGNHGRALAAAAASIGCRCVIVLHAHVSREREDAIAAYGARIVRIAGDYDDSVAEAARLAAANGWHVVSDTSYESYENVPRDVMQGYGVLAAEVVEASDPFTHVILQGGVGGLAAGVASYLWEAYGTGRPTFVVVEPVQADCLFQSARAGSPARASGSVDSVMAGLACGETSPLAWRVLERCVDGFLTIADEDAIAAMRRLASGSDTDIPLVCGESGAAGVAALVTLHENDAMARAGLSHDARVLVIGTEGATAPSVFARLVGTSADEVGARQRAWLAHRTGDSQRV